MDDRDSQRTVTPEAAGNTRLDALPKAASPPSALTQEQAGRYELRREFGRGGQAIVWLAFDGHIGREVAFKQLLPSMAERGATRFLREARVTGQLEHPSIVPVYELGVRPDGSRYYTQKLVRGRTLYEALKACRSLPDRLRLLPHFVDVCQALAYAHGRGVVHRDIKPENVMVGEFGETVVLDWGLAKVKDHDEPAGGVEDLADGNTRPSQTAVGTVLGTPLYMSPEQALGKLHEVDERSDVWSLGAMLFEILTGRVPFLGATSVVVIRKVTTETPPPVRSLCPEAPPELAAVTERALQRERSLRYASARELAAEIEAWQSGARVRAYEYSSWELLKKFVLRNKLLSLVSAAAVALLAVASVLIALAHAESRAHLSEARVNLAEALLEKGRAAAAERRWSRAAVLFAAARAQHDTAAGRWGQGLAERRAELPALRLDARSGALWVVAALPDGNRVAVGGDDGSVRLFDRTTAAEVMKLQAHQGSVLAIAVSPDGMRLVSAGVDGVVRLWDLRTGATLHRSAPGEEVWCAAFSRRGELYAVGRLDGTIQVYRAATGERLAELRGHQERVAGLSFGPDDQLASASFDGSARVWTRLGAEFRESAQIKARHAKWWAAAFSPDGKTVAMAGTEGALRLWTPGSAREAVRLLGHDRTVGAVAFSPDGRLLASSAWDGSVMVWDAGGGRPLLHIDAHARPATAVAFSPDGRLLYSAAEDGLLRSFALPQGAPLSSLAGHAGDVRSVSYARSGALLVSTGADGTVRVWDTALRRELQKLQLKGVARNADFSADGKLLAAGGDDQLVHLWDTRTWKELAPLAGSGDDIWAVRFAPRGTLLATAGNDGAVRLWDAAAGKALRSFDAAQGKVRAVDFSPDATLLATAGTDDTARLWHADTGIERAQLRGHEAHLRAVAFSPDGKLVATGANDRAVLLFDVATAQLVRRLEGHEGQVRGLAFSPDGRTLVTGSADRTVRLWDTLTGEELAQLTRHSDEVLALALSPSSAQVASASRDGDLQLTSLYRSEIQPPAQALAELLRAHRLVLNGLTVEEQKEAAPTLLRKAKGGRRSTAAETKD